MALIAGWGVPCAVVYADAIYKCADAAGHVTYQSGPCKGGARLDIDAGRQDPAAVARLREDQAAFTARDSERREQATREAVARDERAAAEARARAQEAAASADAAPACVDCGWGWGFVLPWGPSPWRPRPPVKPPRPPVATPEQTLPPIPRATPGPPLVASPPPVRAQPLPAGR
ncbi:MAG: hypothetical protein JSR18_10650 [Proteobacteria bacterium]|nr:hypothetical protein [Pseudomonadota bacterium]